MTSFVRLLLYCFCACLGVLFLPLKSFASRQELAQLFEHSTAFILCLVFLEVFRKVLNDYWQPGEGKRKDELLRSFNLVVVLIPLLLSLQFFRSRFEKEVFYILLSSFAISILADRFLRRREYVWGIFAQFFFFFCVSYLSFLVFLGKWLWQPLLICAGLSFELGALDTAKLITSAGFKSESRVLLLKYYSLALCLGPLLIAGLASVAQLPRPYTIILAVLAISSRDLGDFARCIGANEEPRDFLSRATRISLSFVVILLAIRFII